MGLERGRSRIIPSFLVGKLNGNRYLNKFFFEVRVECQLLMPSSFGSKQ